MLQPALGDILLIFDCCYAGILDAHFDGRGHWATRSFELLAACKDDAKTHPPGPKSFTRALIWALTSLLKDREKFSTHELQMRIPHAKGFPRDQVVRIIDRGDPSDHRLVLAPVPLRSNLAKSEPVPSRPPVTRPKKFIDLRFWYTKCPDEDEVNALSSRMKQLLNNEHIKADRVGWVRLGNVDQVRNVVEKWRRLPPRQSTPTLPRLAIPPSPPQSHLQILHTPPPSHSGNSSISDAHLETSGILAVSMKAPAPIQGFEDHVILETNDVPEIRPWQAILPIGLDLRKQRLTDVIFSRIEPPNLVIILTLAYLCFFICSYFYNYFLYVK